MGTEKFCLRWNDFESNISVAFRELREDKDFFDVTLACDDEQMQAHKVILSACSPFFRNVLRKNPHQHPLLYLKGVKYTDLQAVLNFMYHGEVNVAQEELNSFLAVAEDLRVKGLTQNNSGGGGGTSGSRKENNYSVPKSPPATKSAPRPPPSDPTPPPKRPRPAMPSMPSPSVSVPSPHPNKADGRQIQPFGQDDDDDIQEVVPVKSEPRDTSNVIATPSPYPAPSHSQALANPEMDDSMSNYGQDDSYDDYGQYGADGGDQSYDGALVDPNMVAADGNKVQVSNLEELDGTINKLIKKLETGEFQCTVCGKININYYPIRAHCEIHIMTSGFSCDICGRTLKTRNSLSVHKSLKHRFTDKYK